MLNDLRFAFRQLLKNPGFTAVAVLTLALGIGANTAIFSVVYGVLLKPLSYERPGQLVYLWEDPSGTGQSQNHVAGGVFADWKEHCTSFEALALITDAGMNLTGEGRPERLTGALVPIGRQIRFWDETWEVVGVVGSVRHHGLDEPASERIYLPQVFNSSIGCLAVRTTGPPMSFADPVRQTILALDADQPVSNLRPLEQLVANSVAQRRLTLLLIGTFATCALLLAAIGLYGVMAYLVTQRTHEIGVRMALGAQSTDVLKLVLKHGMGLTLLGLTLGLIGAFALTRVIATQLFEVGATDPATLAGVSALLAAVAFAACWLPARRAAKVDPMEALRYE